MNISRIDKLLKRFAIDGRYFHYPEFHEFYRVKEAEELRIAAMAIYKQLRQSQTDIKNLNELLLATKDINQYRKGILLKNAMVSERAPLLRVLLGLQEICPHNKPYGKYRAGHDHGYWECAACMSHIGDTDLSYFG